MSATQSEPKEESPLPSIPRSRPIRKARTLDSSLDDSHDNSTESNEASLQNQEPIIPSHRPIRRSTTEVINNLVEDTNEELEEMEKLIAKHTHHRSHSKNSVNEIASSVSTRDENSSTPSIPKRPQPMKRTSKENISNDKPIIPQRPSRRNTSPLKSSPELGSNEKQIVDPLQDSNESKTTPSIPQQRPLRKKTSSVESATSPKKESTDDNTHQPIDIPVVPRQRPSKGHTINGSDTNSIKDDDVKTASENDISTEELVKNVETPELPEQIKDNHFDNIDACTTNENEQDPVENLNEEEEKTIGRDITIDEIAESEEPTKEYSQPEDLTQCEDNNEASQIEKNEVEVADDKEKVQSDNISEPLSQLDEEKIKHDEGTNQIEQEIKDEKEVENDNEEKSSIYSDKNIKSLLDEVTEVPQGKKIDELNELKGEGKTLSEKEETNIENIPIVTLIDTTPELKDSNNKEEEKTESFNEQTPSQDPQTQPHIPATRPKKKGPPPVPKKPSSRIAAFQEMLQKQQMKDLESKNSNITSGNDDKQAPRKMNFINDLNNLIALPGMAPHEALKPKTETPIKKEEKSEIPVKKDIPHVSQKRARGPRGRKLPSKLNSVSKVIAKNENYTVQVRQVWSLKISPNEIKEEVEEEDKQIGNEIKIEDKEVENEIEIEDRNDTDPYDVNEENDISHDIDQNDANSPSVPNLPGSESTTSLVDRIISRDNNDESLNKESKPVVEVQDEKAEEETNNDTEEEAQGEESKNKEEMKEDIQEEISQNEIEVEIEEEKKDTESIESNSSSNSENNEDMIDASSEPLDDNNN